MALSRGRTAAKHLDNRGNLLISITSLDSLRKKRQCIRRKFTMNPGFPCLLNESFHAIGRGFEGTFGVFEMTCLDDLPLMLGFFP